MEKNSKQFIADSEQLHHENRILLKQLKDAMESIDAIKTGNIDGLIVTNENALQVYTEKSADKPYRILIEKMHEGAVTVSENGTILYSNSYFANMVKRPLQKVIGTKFEKFIDDSAKEQLKAILIQSDKSVLKEEVYINSDDGKKIPALMTINALNLDQIFVLSIILTDLTVQHENQERLKSWTKQLEQKNEELENALKKIAFQSKEKKKRAAELFDAYKELEIQSREKEKRAEELSVVQKDVKELQGLNTHKENVLSTLSHDLRSPLGFIIGVADYLVSDFDELERSKVKEMLEMLLKASIDELDMLDYLGEWARIKFASEAFTPAKIKLELYAKKVMNILTKNADAKNIQLHNEIEKDLSVFADKKMLLSILQNIVSNSIKHTPEDGKITLSAKRNKDKIIVEVKDTGIGMSKEMQKNLFIPQMKSLLNSRKDHNGTGIGLLLVKGFIEKHGGEIWVESVEGKGSSFYFTLPANKTTDKNL